MTYNLYSGSCATGLSNKSVKHEMNILNNKSTDFKEKLLSSNDDNLKIKVGILEFFYLIQI